MIAFNVLNNEYIHYVFEALEMHKTITSLSAQCTVVIIVLNPPYLDLFQFWGHFQRKKLNQNRLHFTTDLGHLILSSECVLHNFSFYLILFNFHFSKPLNFHSYSPHLAHNVSFCSICVLKEVPKKNFNNYCTPKREKIRG